MVKLHFFGLAKASSGGVACLLLPIVNLFFLIMHWDKARKPFFLQLLAGALFLLGFFVLPHNLHH